MRKYCSSKWEFILSPHEEIFVLATFPIFKVEILNLGAALNLFYINSGSVLGLFTRVLLIKKKSEAVFLFSLLVFLFKVQRLMQKQKVKVWSLRFINRFLFTKKGLLFFFLPAPFGWSHHSERTRTKHPVIVLCWMPILGSNMQPLDYKTVALTTELPWRV